MKKNLFYYLFAVICSVTLFTACSDDDEDTTWQQIPEITNDNVTLTLNDKTPTNATVAFDIINAESGKLTLKNVIYGHPTVDVNVTLQKKDDTSYNFTGTTNLEPVRAEAVNSALKVTVTGTVTIAGKVTVDVTTSGWAAVNGVYANDSLAVIVNGNSPVSTYPVTLTATAEGVASLTFDKIVGVVNDFEMEVSLKDGKIEGSKEKEDGYTINVVGTLAANKLTLNVTTTGWATLSGSYYATGNKITYNGAELPNGGYFTIKMKSAESAEISFSNLLSGDRGGVIKNAVVTVKDDVYTIKGKSEFTGYALSFEGTIDANRVLTATANYITVSPIVGTWTPKVVSLPTGNNMVATDIKFETNKGAVTFDESIIEMLPAELKPMFAATMPDAQLAQVLQGLLGTYAVYLKSLTFTEDGQLVVKYVDMPKDINGDGKVDANDIVEGEEEHTFALLKYYIGKDDKLYLTVSISDLMGMIPTNDRAAWDPGTVLTEGIPLNLSVTGNTALISIDQDVLNATTVEFVNGLLGMFGPMIPGFAEQTKLINTIMGALTSILSDTKVLSAGMYFDKK